MTVRVILIGGQAGKMEPQENDGGRNYVRSALKSIGNQGCGIGSEAHQNLG